MLKQKSDIPECKSNSGAIACLVLALLLGVITQAHAAVIVVDTVADPGAPGECSLRDAIKSANEDPIDPPSLGSSCEPGDGQDDIVFHDVPGFGATPVMLDLIAGLPAITSEIWIDGSIPEHRSLPGNPNKRPGVVIAPATVPTFKFVPGFGVAPWWPNGLYLKGPGASGSIIRGMVVINDGRTSLFCRSPYLNPDPADPTVPELELCGVGVLVFGANNTTIAGNYVGVNKDGLALPPIPEPDPGFGMMLDTSTTAIEIMDGSDNVIGGNTANDRNITRSARGVTLAGQLTPGAIRIDLFGWAEPAFGAPKKTNYNQVLNNYVNVDAEGTYFALSAYGIWHFSENWPDDTFGVGQYGWGPQCATSDPQDPDHCEMIGTVFRGNTIVSNSTNLDFYGYNEDVVVDNNTFMTTDNGGFGYLLTIADEPGSRETPAPGIAMNMVVTDNRMGIDQDGNLAGSPFFNVNLFGGDGIVIKNNIMTNSKLQSILLQDLRVLGAPDLVTNVTISRNSMYNNSVFGGWDPAIDLAEDGNVQGVTLNDTDDADTGVNNLQNFPVLTEVRFNPAQAFIEGTFHGKPKSNYVIEVFSNDELSLSGYGEGKKFLADQNIKTDKDGNADIKVHYHGWQDGLLADEAGKTYLTTTATARFCEEEGYSCETGATSEFSESCEIDLNDMGTVETRWCNSD